MRYKAENHTFVSVGGQGLSGAAANAANLSVGCRFGDSLIFVPFVYLRRKITLLTW